MKATAEQHQALFDFLADGKWHKAPEIRKATGLKEVTIRVIANECGGQILGGQEGYKLTRCATSSEIRHAVASLRSRASAINQRAVETALFLS